MRCNFSGYSGISDDNIGNRQSAKNGGDSSGNNLRQSSYMANALNQYSQRTNPGAADVLGTSDAAATVTVNNQQTYRKGAYFQTVLNFDNSVNPVSSAVNVVGVKQNVGANGEDAVETKTGSVYLPPALESYSYDLDGNLLTDGRWQYVWDAENRLVSMTALTNVPASAKKKLEFAYDYASRRIQKKVYAWNVGTNNYQLQSTTKFVYDGWNPIAELDENTALVKSYVWGQDVSGKLQKAGGIGGLLFITQETNIFQTGYDGNGNLTLLVKSGDGKAAAFYDYNPFGETLQENGAKSQVNPFRFSTKYTDVETSFIYYGYRYYNPQTGKWISRDPIEEIGGVNLYGLAGNDVVNKVDILGMYIEAIFYRTQGKLVVNDFSKHWFWGTDQSSQHIFENIFSGDGDCKNKKYCDANKDEGPIPKGFYLIPNNEDVNAPQGGWRTVSFRLYRSLQSSKNPWEGPFEDDYTKIVDPIMGAEAMRGGFYLHPGSSSLGCVTFPKDKTLPNGIPWSAEFERLRKIIKNTSPYIYKGQKWAGRLIVL